MDPESPSSELKHRLRKHTAELARSPRNPLILQQMAEVLIQLDRRHEGLSCYLNSGQCFLEKQQFRQAGSVFRKVLELEPSHEKAMEGVTAAEREEIRTVVGGPRGLRARETWTQKVVDGDPVVVVRGGGSAGESTSATVLDPPVEGDLYDPRVRDQETLCRDDDQQQGKRPGWQTIDRGWDDEDEVDRQFALTNTMEINDDDVVEEAEVTGVRGGKAVDLFEDLQPVTGDLSDTIVDIISDDIDLQQELVVDTLDVVVDIPDSLRETQASVAEVEDDDHDDLDLDELFGSGSPVEEVLELRQMTPRPTTPKRVATVRDEPSDFSPRVQPLPLPKEFCATGEALTLEAGENVFEELEHSNDLYMLVHGRVEIHKKVREYGGHAGSVRRLATLEEDSCFGVFAMLGDGIRHLTVKAVEPSELLRFSKAQVKALMRSDSAVNKAIRKMYRDHLMETTIKVSPLLRPLAHETASKLIKLCKPRKYARGDVVFRQGDSPSGLYLVLLGTLEATCASDDDPDPKLLRRLMDGDFFGGISMILGKPASATVVARSFSQLFHILPNDFFRFAADVPEMLSVVEAEAKRRDQGFRSIMEGKARFEVGTTVYLLEDKKKEE